MGCDYISKRWRRMRAISIHAPAWGATVSYVQRDQRLSDISIHAPAWGATSSYLEGSFGGDGFQSTHPHGVRPAGRPPICSLLSFQSTHPHGVRPMYDDLTPDDIRISIHAPAWGATKLSDVKEQFSKNFNPRTRMGCDIKALLKYRRLPLFQSTHPHGVRLSISFIKSLRFMQISIHAPAWGATIEMARDAIGLMDFNPRTRMGCDQA